eukprot:423562_1
MGSKTSQHKATLSKTNKSSSQETQKIISPSIDYYPQKLNLILNGYIRQLNTSNVSNDMIELILKFVDQSEYIQILINSSHGKLVPSYHKNNKIQMPSNVLFSFNEVICPNCRSENKLQYIASYEGYDNRNESSKEIKKWYNHCNEYQCENCKSYIAHNVKRKYTIYLSYSPRLGHEYFWISPVGCYNLINYSLDEMFEKYKLRGKCHECGKETLLLSSSMYAYDPTCVMVDKMYCVQCELFHEHEDES